MTGAFSDTAALVRFRATTIRGRGRRTTRLALAAALLVLSGAALAPGWFPDGDPSRTDVTILIPSICLGVVLLATVAAATSGGGRQLFSRDESVAFPLGPTVDHLGALVLAPLNIAWILQSVTLLGVVAYGFGVSWALAPIQLITVLWLVAATTTAQALSWTIEWIRRGPGGRWLVRAGAAAGGAAVAWLAWSGRLSHLLDTSPLTRWVLLAQIDAANGRTAPWLTALAGLLAIIAVTGVLGSVMAGRVAKRMPLDQVRLESAHHRPRPSPRADLVAMMRIDASSVWRSVPLRRGVVTLGILPGAIALAGNMEWPSVALLPGLVCSGAGLLFGVNAWCLDGRGALWRETLPAQPGQAYVARTLVLIQVLAVALAPTLLLASFRAGRPTVDQAAAVGCATVVAIVHVVASCMTSSVRTPYAADLGDARATPAPPLAMLRYSARLAGSTTLLGLIFNGTAHAPASWSFMIALPLILFSCRRIVRAAGLWSDPLVRSRVLTTVVG